MMADLIKNRTTIWMSLILSVLLPSVPSASNISPAGHCEPALISSLGESLDEASLSWINLLNHFLLRSVDHGLIAEALDAITESEAPINPVDPKIVSHSNPTIIQIYNGFLKLLNSESSRERISSDWPAIQKKIPEILGKLNLESGERQKKMLDTGYVFSPKLVLNHSAGRDIRSTPAWIRTDDGREFMAVGSEDYNLYFFEREKGKIIFRDKYPAHNAVTGGPSWFKAKTGEIFLAAGSRDGSVRLYKLEEDSLESKGALDLKSAVEGTPAWISTPRGETFFAVGTESGLSVVQVDFQGGVEPSMKIQAEHPLNRVMSLPQWIIDESNNTHIVAQSLSGVHHISMRSDHKIRALPGGSDGETSPAMIKTQNGRQFLVYGSQEKFVFLYELVNDKLIQRDRIKLKEAISSSIAVAQLANDRHLLALGLPEGLTEIYEIVDDKLKLVQLLDTKKVKQNARPSFLLDNYARLFLAMELGKEIQIFELIGAQFQPKKDLKFDDNLSTPAVWHLSDSDQTLISAGSVNGRIYTYSIFDFLDIDKSNRY